MSSIGFYWSRLTEDERVYVLNVALDAKNGKCMLTNTVNVDIKELFDMKIIERKNYRNLATNETKEFLNTLLNVEYFDVSDDR